MIKYLLLFSFIAISFLASCGKDDVTPKASKELTGTWEAVQTYNYNEPDRDRATKYILNLIQTQSGAVSGDGRTSYTKVEFSQAKESDWRGPFPFSFKSISYDHPIFKFTLKYESGEEDEVFEGLVSDDRNSIKGNIKWASATASKSEIIFKRQ